MQTTATIQSHADSFHQISFVNYVEKQMRSGWKPKKLQEAIRGTYNNFAPELRAELDEYLHRYLEKWLVSDMRRHDLYIVFISTAEDLRANAPRHEGEPSDEHLIDMFSILMMKVVRLAYVTRSIRYDWGIKKNLLW